jgi:hypothetical protein
MAGERELSGYFCAEVVTRVNIQFERDDTTINRMHDSLPDSDAVLAQFNRLIQELLRGNMHRNTFRPWEVELLLDIESCNLRESSKRETLRRYQKAVQRHMEKGARLPLKLSEYMDAVKAKRAAQAPTPETPQLLS